MTFMKKGISGLRSWRFSYKGVVGQVFTAMKEMVLAHEKASYQIFISFALVFVD